ncbi:putative Ubiquitin carboxyl-terminal hydrolase [Blattamonas nauphoetae]|uniref:Ubiquitin carboxyl-terminal hydrolase n=1 Tax=Blattamonas nauphoetae TaxID=2049346 RepID=A0ABQ9XZS9_9EUKA|nr:putative Ubiquitin carboxyl-terminal hydrolase [Blattamonas nauphoetae]
MTQPPSRDFDQIIEQIFDDKPKEQYQEAFLELLTSTNHFSLQDCTISAAKLLKRSNATQQDAYHPHCGNLFILLDKLKDKITLKKHAEQLTEAIKKSLYPPNPELEGSTSKSGVEIDKAIFYAARNNLLDRIYQIDEEIARPAVTAMMYWVCAFKFDLAVHLFENSSFISKKFDLSLIWNDFSSLRIDPVQHRSSHQGPSNIYPITPSPPSDIFYLPPPAHTLDTPFNYSSDSQKTIQNKHCVNPNQTIPEKLKPIPLKEPPVPEGAVYRPEVRDIEPSIKSETDSVIKTTDSHDAPKYDHQHERYSIDSDNQTNNSSHCTAINVNAPQTTPSPTPTPPPPTANVHPHNLVAADAGRPSIHSSPPFSVGPNQTDPSPNDQMSISSEGNDHQQASEDEVDTVIQADNGADWSYNSEKSSERSDLTSNSSQPTAQYEPNANAPPATGGVLVFRVGKSSKTGKENESSQPAPNEPNPSPHASQPTDNASAGNERDGTASDSAPEVSRGDPNPTPPLFQPINMSARNNSIADDSQEVIRDATHNTHQPPTAEPSNALSGTDPICRDSKASSDDAADSENVQDDPYSAIETSTPEPSNAAAWNDAAVDEYQDFVQEDPHNPHQLSTDEQSNVSTDTGSIYHNSEEPSDIATDSGSVQEDPHNVHHPSTDEHPNRPTVTDMVEDELDDTTNYHPQGQLLRDPDHNTALYPAQYADNISFSSERITVIENVSQPGQLYDQPDDSASVSSEIKSIASSQYTSLDANVPQTPSLSRRKKKPQIQKTEEGQPGTDLQNVQENTSKQFVWKDKQMEADPFRLRLLQKMSKLLPHSQWNPSSFNVYPIDVSLPFSKKTTMQSFPSIPAKRRPAHVICDPNHIRLEVNDTFLFGHFEDFIHKVLGPDYPFPFHKTTAIPRFSQFPSQEKRSSHLQKQTPAIPWMGTPLDYSIIPLSETEQHDPLPPVNWPILGSDVLNEIMNDIEDFSHKGTLEQECYKTMSIIPITRIPTNLSSSSAYKALPNLLFILRCIVYTQEVFEQDMNNKESLLRDSSELLSHLLDTLEEHCPENDNHTLPLALRDCMLLFLQASTTEDMTQNNSLSQLFLRPDNTHPKSTHFYFHLLQKQLDDIILPEDTSNPSTCVVRSLHSPTTLFVLHRLSHLFRELLKSSEDISCLGDLPKVFSSLIKIIPIVVEHEQTTFEQRLPLRTDFPNPLTFPDDTENLSPLFILLNLTEIVSRNLIFEIEHSKQFFRTLCSLFSSNTDIPHNRPYSIPIKRIAVTLSCRLLNQYPSLPSPQPHRQRQLRFVGLDNAGETCYLAVTIQLLIHIPQFYHLISHIDTNQITDDPIQNNSTNIKYRDLVHNLKTLFSRYSHAETASIPFEEAAFFKKYHPTHDSSLFYKTLLTDLHDAFQMTDLTQLAETINTCFKVHSEERDEENELHTTKGYHHTVRPSSQSLVDELNKPSLAFTVLPKYLFIDLTRAEKTNSLIKIDEHIEFPYGMHPLSLSTGDVKHNFLLTAVILPSERRSKPQHFQIIQKVSMGRWLCLSDGTITEVDEEAIPVRCFGLKNDFPIAKFLLYTNTDQDTEQLQNMIVVEDSQQQLKSVYHLTIDHETYKLFEEEIKPQFTKRIPTWIQKALNEQATMLTANPLGNLPLECAFRHLNNESLKGTPLSLVSSFTTKLNHHPSPIEAQQLVGLSLCLMCKSCDRDSSSLDTLFHEMEHRDSRAFSKLDTWKIVEIIASFPELLTDPDVLNHFYSSLASILEDQSQLAMLFTFTRLFTNQFIQVAQSTILCDEHSVSAFLSMALESGINKSIEPPRIVALWAAHPDCANTNLPILLRKASRMRLIPTFVEDLVKETFAMLGPNQPLSKSDFELNTVATQVLTSLSLTKFFFQLRESLFQILSRPSLRPPIRDILFRTVLKEPVDGVFPRYDEMYNAYQTAVDETALESTFKRKEYQIPSTVADEFLTYNKQFTPPHDNEAISDIWRLFFLLTFGNHQRTILKKLPDNMQDHFLSLWTQKAHSNWNLKCLHIIFTVTLPFKDRFLKKINRSLTQFHFPEHPTTTQSFLILSMLSAYDFRSRKPKYQEPPKPFILLSGAGIENNLDTIIRTLVDDIKPKVKKVKTSSDDHLSDNIRKLLLSIAQNHPSDRSNILRESMLRVLSELVSVDSFLVSLLFCTLCKIDYNSDISTYPLKTNSSFPITLLNALTNSLSEHASHIFVFAQITANTEHESFFFGTIPFIFTALSKASTGLPHDDHLRGSDSPSIPYKTLGEVLLALSHPLFRPHIRSYSLQFLLNLLPHSSIVQQMLFSSLICTIIPEYSEALDQVQAYEVGSESSPPTLDMDRSIIERYLPDAFIFPSHNTSFPKLPSFPLLLSSSPSVWIGGKYIGLDVTPKVDDIRDALINNYLEKLMTSNPVWVVVFCAYFFKFCDKMPFYDKHKAKVETMLFNMKLWENLKNSTTNPTATQLDIINEIVKRDDLSPNNSSKEEIVNLIQYMMVYDSSDSDF